jgi:hypothetical protein
VIGSITPSFSVELSQLGRPVYYIGLKCLTTDWATNLSPSGGSAD